MLEALKNSTYSRYYNTWCEVKEIASTEGRAILLGILSLWEPSSFVQRHISSNNFAVWITLSKPECRVRPHLFVFPLLPSFSTSSLDLTFPFLFLPFPFDINVSKITHLFTPFIFFQVTRCNSRVLQFQHRKKMDLYRSFFKN